MAFDLLWAKRLRQGSFRGVEFFIDSHTFTGGRRKQDHEFPQRDLGITEDMGRALRKFQLELFVLGDDYFAQRDALIEALETRGPGELVHPYLGQKTVQAGTFSLSETIGEGRIARFSLTFTEAGEAVFPQVFEDNITKTTVAADLTIDNSKSFFEQVFSVVAQAAHVVDDAIESVNAAIDFLEESVKAVTEPIADLTRKIQDLKADTAALVALPGELADRIADVFDSLINELEDDPATSAQILGNFVGFDLPVATGDTVSVNRINSNNDAVKNFAKQIAVSNESKAAVNQDFISSNSALDKRDAISDNIDDLIAADILTINPDGFTFSNQSIDDELFQSLKDLKASIVKTLPPQGLASVSTYTPPKTMPAIVIAYQLFKDIEKEQEIIEQNDIAHPGFVPGNDEIEVIGVGV